MISLISSIQQKIHVICKKEVTLDELQDPTKILNQAVKELSRWICFDCDYP
jgi:hypothetical protein